MGECQCCSSCHLVETRTDAEQAWPDFCICSQDCRQSNSRSHHVHPSSSSQVFAFWKQTDWKRVNHFIYEIISNIEIWVYQDYVELIHNLWIKYRRSLLELSQFLFFRFFFGIVLTRGFMKSGIQNNDKTHLISKKNSQKNFYISVNDGLCDITN